MRFTLKNLWNCLSQNSRKGCATKDAPLCCRVSIVYLFVLRFWGSITLCSDRIRRKIRDFQWNILLYFQTVYFLSVFILLATLSSIRASKSANQQCTQNFLHIAALWALFRYTILTLMKVSEKFTFFNYSKRNNYNLWVKLTATKPQQNFLYMLVLKCVVVLQITILIQTYY